MLELVTLHLVRLDRARLAQGLRQGVVLREEFELAVAQAVGAGVADPGDVDPVFVEEGQGFAGFSSELIAQIAEREPGLLGKVVRVMPPPTAIPAAKAAESAMLPNATHIIAAVLKQQKV